MARSAFGKAHHNPDDASGTHLGSLIQLYIKPGEREGPNSAPTITVEEISVSGTTVIIKVNGSDADGDTLTYGLKIGSTNYTPTTVSADNKSATFNITGLTELTQYQYTATASDQIITSETSGTVQWCSGNTDSHAAESCSSGVVQIDCPNSACYNGTCYSDNWGTRQWPAANSPRNCDECQNSGILNTMSGYVYSCADCGTIGLTVWECSECGQVEVESQHLCRSLW